MPTVADAAVAVRGDLTEFNQDLKRGGEQGTRTLGQQLKSVFSPKNLAVAGVAGGVALAGAITAGLAGAVKSLIDIERLNAQTDAAIRSTGGAANVTREDIEQMGEALEKTTTIEREAVQEAANLLLTFTNIRNEAGKGNDIFDQTTEAVLDMSVAMGTDARTAAMQLGKALNDPVKGMAQLARSGVQFTDAQKDMVAALVESGDLLGAQKVILKELETQFGDSAEAFANTTAGKIARFQNDIGNMFESIILGAVEVSDWLGDDAFEGFAMNFGEQGDIVHNLAERMGEDFDTLKTRIETRMDESGDSFSEAVDFISAETDRMANNAEEGAHDGIGRMAAAFRDGAPAVAEEARKIAALPRAMMVAEYAALRAAAYQSQVEIAKGLMDGQNAPQVAMDAALQLLEDELTREQEIVRLKGQEIALATAAGIAAQEGKDAARIAIDASLQVVRDRLKFLQSDFYKGGYNIGVAWANGLRSAAGYARLMAWELAASTNPALHGRSPPKEGPLKDIDKGGLNVGLAWAGGLLDSIGAIKAASLGMAGALVPGMAVPGMALAGAGVTPSGGITYQLVLNGVPKTFNSEQAMLDALKDLSAFGEGRLS